MPISGWPVYSFTPYINRRILVIVRATAAASHGFANRIPMDILINKNFDVELDDRNDLAMVEGRRAVEQSIAMMVNSYFYEHIGSTSAVNAVEKLELETQRVVEENPHVESIKKAVAEKVTAGDGTAGGLRVTLVYDTGETTSFGVGD